MKKIILLLCLASLLVSCATLDDTDDSYMLVPVETETATLSLSDGSYFVRSTTVNMGFQSVFVNNYVGFDHFVAFIYNLSPKTIRFLESEIEFFTGSIVLDEWESLGKWSTEKFKQMLRENYKKAYPLLEQYQTEPYVQNVLSNSLRSNDIAPNSYCAGRIALPAINQDVKIVYTDPLSGEEISHLFRYIRN